MYPTLTDFFRDVFGVNIPLPVQTYGFFVAAAFLIGIYVLAKELKRKEKEGLVGSITKRIKIGEPAKLSALVLAGVGGFIVGFKLLEAVLHYSDFVDNPQDFILSARGNLLGGILGAGISVYLNWKEKQKTKLDKPKWVDKTVMPHQLAGTMLIVATIFGLLGAKLFHNLENLDEFMADPMGSLFSFSGLTFLGGLIVGITAVLYYGRKNNIPSLHLLDTAAPAIPIAYATGRMGCHISGDGCWGVPNPAPKPDWMSFLPDWMWSYDYPNNVINAGSKMVENCGGSHCHVLDVPVFPTSFYEASIMVVGFLIIWSIRKKINVPGVMFMIFLTFAGIERFLMEQIRINNKLDVLGFDITQAEIISSIMILLGTIGIIFFLKKGHQVNAWLNSKMKIPETVQQQNT